MRQKYIGKALPQLDSFHKVTGIAKYTHDISLPGMLHVKLVTSTEPHAEIINIDASEALKIPGVVAVLTGKDFP